MLTDLKCVACRAGEPTVTPAELDEYRPQVPRWEVLEFDGIPRLVRVFPFSTFRHALDFTVQVGELAEQEGHHPVIKLEWGKVTITWWTHKIKGLHRNDFIAAAKTDRLYEQAPGKKP